jgi:hypothetical protein
MAVFWLQYIRTTVQAHSNNTIALLWDNPNMSIHSSPNEDLKYYIKAIALAKPNKALSPFQLTQILRVVYSKI